MCWQISHSLASASSLSFPSRDALAQAAHSAAHSLHGFTQSSLGTFLGWAAERVREPRPRARTAIKRRVMSGSNLRGERPGRGETPHGHGGTVSAAKDGITVLACTIRAD